MIPYEHVGRGGDRVMTDWSLAPPQLRQVKNLLITLENADRDQAVGSIIFKIGGTGVRKGKSMRKIYYAKTSGQMALRPRCCIGPHDGERVTFLERVQKSGGVESPGLSESKAPERMAEVAETPAASSLVTFHRRQSNEG